MIFFHREILAILKCQRSSLCSSPFLKTYKYYSRQKNYTINCFLVKNLECSSSPEFVLAHEFIMGMKKNFHLLYMIQISATQITRNQNQFNPNQITLLSLLHRLPRCFRQITFSEQCNFALLVTRPSYYSRSGL